jgi:flagellar hook-associated protein 3 FlgL
MRVSTNQFHSQGISSIQKHQSDVLDTQLKLSTGKRVNVASDDPVATTQIHSLNRTISTIDQYSKNGELAKSQLALEETAIADTIDSLQRARELGIQMLNGTYSDENKKSSAVEIDQIILQVRNMMNYTSSEGEKLFAGNSVLATQAFVEDPVNDGYYTYIGSPNATDPLIPSPDADAQALYGSRFVQIGFDDDNKVTPNDMGDSSRVRITDNGARAFAVDASLNAANLDETTGVDNNILNVLVNMSNLLKGGTSQAMAVENGSPAGTPPTLSDVVGMFDSSIENLSQVRSEIGGRQNRIEAQYDAGESFKIALEERRMGLEDMDIVKGVTDLTQSQNALEMAQQVFTRVQSMSLFDYLR